MAVFFRGMTTAERVALTRAMTRIGHRYARLARSRGSPGPVLDKHSTGGVGDKVSLMLAPIVAACGGFVPMISGRGLGHTGGTLDKLGAIPGYRTDPDIATFRRVVREAGCAIIGQTDDLAPADRRLYAIRDVTATVESIPLIAASILSKKLAEGLDGLVMDVKTGSGAFMSDPAMAMAQDLAQSLVAVANRAGLPTVALITDMDWVLGRNVGNALEVAEAVDYLTGRGARDPRLHEVVLALAGEMLALGGLALNPAARTRERRARLADGRRRGEICPHGGGPRRPGRFPRTRVRSSGACPYQESLYRRALGLRDQHGCPPGRRRRRRFGGRARPGRRHDRSLGRAGGRGRCRPRGAAGRSALPRPCRERDGGRCRHRLLRRAIRIGDAPPTIPPIVLARIGR